MGKVLAKRNLVAHASCIAPALTIGAELMLVGSGMLRIEYLAVGDIGALAVPAPSNGSRTDGLWEHTCFEAFFALGNGGYFEQNYSPSGDWASYRFDAYRERMAPEGPLPLLHLERGAERLCLIAEVEMPDPVSAIGLSAVIEATDGTKSYWALAHPPGDKPDFHHPDCFVLELPATA